MWRVIAVAGLLCLLLAGCQGDFSSPSAPGRSVPAPRPTATFTPTPTPLPPIALRLNWVKADEAEDVQGFSAGELFGLFVVTDGKKTQSGRFPPTGVYGSYRNSSTQQVGQLLFHSPKASDALRLYLALWEQDGCLGDYLAIAVTLLNLGTGGLAEGIISSIIAEKVEEARASAGPTCDQDDQLGAYEKVWSKADQWGVGTHEVRSANDNVTFNFTIEGPRQLAKAPTAPSAPIMRTPTRAQLRATRTPTSVRPPVPTAVPLPTPLGSVSDGSLVGFKVRDFLVHKIMEPFGRGEPYIVMVMSDGERTWWTRSPDGRPTRWSKARQSGPTQVSAG